MKRSVSPVDLWLPDDLEAMRVRRGFSWIAGIDEAGRGPLAGPVVAAAVVLPPGLRVPGLDDSKRLTPRRREGFYDLLLREAVSIGIHAVEPDIIDRINILEATRLAMREAVRQLSITAEIALIDGLPVPDFPIEARSVVRGDASCLPIAAASVLAKVTRDRRMTQLHEQYPNYRFDHHKGYPTADHLQRLRLYGPCPAHRQSFRPVRVFGGNGGGILGANDGVPADGCADPVLSTVQREGSPRPNTAFSLALPGIDS